MRSDIIIGVLIAIDMVVHRHAVEVPDVLRQVLHQASGKGSTIKSFASQRPIDSVHSILIALYRAELHLFEERTLRLNV